MGCTVAQEPLLRSIAVRDQSPKAAAVRGRNGDRDSGAHRADSQAPRPAGIPIRINDLENLPFFLVAGLLFLLTEPSLLVARSLTLAHVISRLLHYAAFFQPLLELAT